MSRAQLFRKVKAWTNITPHNFIRLCRLKKAALMLKEKSHNVTEAAFAVGFKSVSHFSKAFNKQFNQTPSNYFKS
jgi:AraC-like DNA-binding protein